MNYRTGVQPMIVRLNIEDRASNLRSDTISLNVKMQDNNPPLITMKVNYLEVEKEM